MAVKYHKASTKKRRAAALTPRRKSRVWPGTPEFRLRLEKIAFKPYTQTWKMLADLEGIRLDTLNDWRAKYATEIEDIQREKFLSARAPVEHALIERATGWKDQPPDTKAIEYFFERFEHLAPQAKDASFDLFAGNYYPQQHQILPLFHWDNTFQQRTPDAGHDQIVVWNSGRGGGKSRTLTRKALYLAKINRGRQGIITAPTYKMLTDPLEEYFDRALEECKIPFKHYKKDSYYELWGDTRIHFRSFDNVDTIRGLDLAWALGDEMRDGSKYVFDTLVACVRDPEAKLRQVGLFTTPNGFDYLYDLARNPESPLVKSGRCVHYSSPSGANTRLPIGFLQLLAEAYDELVFKQEALGQIVNVTQGQIYYNFDRAVHVGDYEFDPALPIWIGQDFNYNPLCSVIGQPHRSEDGTELWIIDEVRIEGSSTEQLCQELIRRGYDPQKIKGEENLLVFPDASGSGKSAVAGSLSNHAIMENHGFRLLHPRANCFVRDRYNAVNGLLRNSRGNVRLRFDQRCKYTIADMERDAYTPGSNLRDNSTEEAKKRGHLADGLGYMVHYNFRIESAFSHAYRYS